MSNLVSQDPAQITSYERLLERLAPKAPSSSNELSTLSSGAPQALKDAMDRLSATFRKVVPDTRRTLKQGEVDSLIEEKAAMDEVTSLLKKRATEIKGAVFNAMDIMAEQDGDVPEDEIGGTHLIKQAIPHSSEARYLSREPRKPTMAVDPDALRELAADKDSPLTHNDYLSMTKQTRVIVPEQVLLYLKNLPEDRRSELMAEMAKAQRITRKGSASLYVRKG